MLTPYEQDKLNAVSEVSINNDYFVNQLTALLGKEVGAKIVKLMTQSYDYGYTKGYYFAIDTERKNQEIIKNLQF